MSIRRALCLVFVGLSVYLSWRGPSFLVDVIFLGDHRRGIPRTIRTGPVLEAPMYGSLAMFASLAVVTVVSLLTPKPKIAAVDKAFAALAAKG